MWHGVDSLNVAAASAVAFWELGKMGKEGNWSTKKYKENCRISSFCMVE